MREAAVLETGRPGRGELCDDELRVSSVDSLSTTTRSSRAVALLRENAAQARTEPVRPRSSRPRSRRGRPSERSRRLACEAARRRAPPRLRRRGRWRSGSAPTRRGRERRLRASPSPRSRAARARESCRRSSGGCRRLGSCRVLGVDLLAQAALRAGRPSRSRIPPGRCRG